MSALPPHDPARAANDPYARPAAPASAANSPRDRAPVFGRRPVAIVALAAAFALGAMFILLGAFALLGTGLDFPGGDDAATGRPDALGYSLVFGLLVLVFTIAMLAVAYGLWTRERWAWYAALALVVLAVVASVIAIIGGNAASGILALLVSGVVAWALLTPDVQEWFGLERRASARVGRPA